jgi:hypothetical protein
VACGRYISEQTEKEKKTPVLIPPDAILKSVHLVRLAVTAMGTLELSEY